MNDERVYLDPLGTVYVDEDGDPHFDCPRIAELFHCTLDEAMKIAADTAMELGYRTALAADVKKERGN